jgi:hypothetical protein
MKGTVVCRSMKFGLGISKPQHLLYFLPLPQGHGAFLNRISMVPPEDTFSLARVFNSHRKSGVMAGRKPSREKYKVRLHYPISSGIRIEGILYLPLGSYSSQ